MQPIYVHSFYGWHDALMLTGHFDLLRKNSNAETDIPQLRSKQYGNLSPQIAARSLHGIIAIDDIRYLPK